MKQYVLLFILIFFAKLGISEPTQVSQLWVNQKYGFKTHLVFKQNAIIAKNLGRNGNTTFKRTRRGEYKSYWGSKLIVEANNIIVFSRRGRKNIVFRPLVSHHPVGLSKQPTGLPDISGEWSVDKQDLKVIIKRTKTGIKAKFSNSTNWVNYVRKDNNYYEDSAGNSYTLNADGQIVWFSDDGRNRYYLRN